MFDRFTDRAKRSMSFARQVAQELGHEEIRSEHMLVGVARAEGGVASQVLLDLGATPEVLLAAVRERLGSMERDVHGQLPFTPNAKTSLEEAMEAASELCHDYIGTEHLLLGLCRTRRGGAAAVLAGQGGALRVEEDTLAFLGVGRTATPRVRIAFLRIPATDIAVMRAFYESALGWRFVEQGEDVLSFSVHSAGFDGCFHRVESPPPRGGTVIVLHTNDLDGVATRILEAGGEVLDRIRLPEGRGEQVHFLDPSGNELAIWGG